MSEKNLFNFIVSRVHARETSTLTIATVTASASLVLFALVIQNEINSEDIRDVIHFLGFLSAIIGFFYYQITQFTIQTKDFEWIRNTILEKIETTERKKEVEKLILGPTHQRVPRAFSFQLFLISPLFGWIYITIQWFFVPALFVFPSMILFLIYIRHRQRHSK